MHLSKYIHMYATCMYMCTTFKNFHTLSWRSRAEAHVSAGHWGVKSNSAVKQAASFYVCMYVCVYLLVYTHKVHVWASDVRKYMWLSEALQPILVVLLFFPSTQGLLALVVVSSFLHLFLLHNWKVPALKWLVVIAKNSVRVFGCNAASGA